MKVILLRDVAKIGKRYEVKEVPDGFALNKLIPQKDALPALPANIKRVEALKSGKAQAQADVGQLIAAVIESCTKEPLVINMEANQQGHLFQSVQATTLTTVLAERGYVIETGYLKFTSPIKTVGEHSVSIAGGGKTGSLSIKVLANNH